MLVGESGQKEQNVIVPNKKKTNENPNAASESAGCEWGKLDPRTRELE